MLVDKKFVKKIWKTREPRSHKGQNGAILVVGGSRMYFGSPALVGFGALRAGADLAYLLVPEYISRVVASYSPDFIVWGYEGEYLSEKARALFDELKERADVMVIGNGLTKNKSVLEVARKFAGDWEKPLIIDADLIGVKLNLKSRNVFYTPHVVEFKRLTGKLPSASTSERAQEVLVAARKLRATVILKGAVDVISDGKNVALNKTGNAGMTHGGTGDVMAGVLAAFVAQKYSDFNAACLAAHVNGLAGDLAFKKLGYSLTASDVLANLPGAILSVS
ncbi:MAG: NAD(P)H-hydrate dehydratase [Candidatus Micrarchaeota archaeon]